MITNLRSILKVLLEELKSQIEAYDCTKATEILSSEYSLESIKSASESLFDNASYSEVLPSEGFCSLLRPLYTWLQKALAAREAAMTYFQETKEISLEVVK